ncbi:MAG TPA: DinB family protein [Candidatus Didemnitutus sp.]|nr:DinB family protein [Candidatus Didemnitutus sp.]
MSTTLEPWLRSPLPNIIDELQPVASMFIAAKEDILKAVSAITANTLWEKSGGAASIGFHIVHLAGATDRLLSYAEGAELTDEQKEELSQEREADHLRPALDYVVLQLAQSMDLAVRRLEGVTAEQLSTQRELGRARVPTTMRSLIAHAGEHAARHAGQIVTTVKIVTTHV